MTEKNVQAPFDAEGPQSEKERTEQAMRGFVREFGRTSALYIEACVHCGMCAEACHFYEVTKDAKYTPIWKIEPLKQAYKREYGPFAPLFRLLNLKSKINADELENWQELIYDSCTLCGRCSLVCPMGIDISGLVEHARHGMAQAGLVPKELWALAHRDDDGEPGIADFRALVRTLSVQHAIAIPLDKPKADILCTISTVELTQYPDAILAMAKVMNHLGLDWTFRTDGFEASSAGVHAGEVGVQKQANLKIIEAAIDCGARLVVLPECGHAYHELRWSGADDLGAPLPFAVQHISEFLADQVTSGALKLNKVDKSATFHDPCQVGRRGGAIEAPRTVLAALGLDLHEMTPTKDTNWCCGGGGGVSAIRRADPLRHAMFHLKREQIEETGAELALTSCSGCRHSFDEAQTHFKETLSMGSLLELVAANLSEA